MASEKAEFSLNYPQQTAIGSSFTVEVELANNPGLIALQFTLAFDKAVLNCTAISKGAVLEPMMSAENPAAPDGAIVAAASATEVGGDGIIAVAEFTVLAAGDYGFELNDIIASDGEGTSLAYTVLGQEDSSANPQPPTDNGGGGNSSGSGGSDSNATSDEPSSDLSEEAAGNNPFSDTTGHWAEAKIAEAATLGLVEGHGNGIYAPDDYVTRGQMITILWRNAGSPMPKSAAPFSDLNPAHTYYHQPIAWAAENGIVYGYDEQTFGPEDFVTREQLTAILFRLSGSVTGLETTYYSIYDQNYLDEGEVLAEFRPAVYWAVYNEIYTGTDSLVLGDTLAAKQFASRAQIAVMLVNYNNI